MKNLQNSFLTVAMAIGLAITGLTPAHASTPAVRETYTVPETAITASTTAHLGYERPTVKTSPKALPQALPPAKTVDAPVEIVQPQSSESVSTVAKTAQPQAAAPKVVPAPVAAVGVSGSAIASAALAQLGVSQDCTALVTNSLAAVGIHFHGWPAAYLSLGHTVSAAEAQPGDLAYYENGGMGEPHIAVYIGNGMAVHGGWNGGTTAVYSVNVGSGPVFIHVR